MVRIHTGAAFAAALLASCTSAPPTAPSVAPTTQSAIISAPVAAPVRAPDLSRAESPEAVGSESARLKKLDDYMAGVVSSGRVAGMTTLLARHGKIVDFRTYGKASLETGAPILEDTIFRIYSMTKPVTGVAMMILFEEGKWRLDDPVTRFVPEFKNLRVVKSVNKDGTMVLEDMQRPPTMREIM